MKRLITLSALCTALVLVGLPAAAPSRPPPKSTASTGPAASQPADQVTTGSPIHPTP